MKNVWYVTTGRGSSRPLFTSSGEPFLCCIIIVRQRERGKARVRVSEYLVLWSELWSCKCFDCQVQFSSVSNLSITASLGLSSLRTSQLPALQQAGPGRQLEKMKLIKPERVMTEDWGLRTEDMSPGCYHSSHTLWWRGESWVRISEEWDRPTILWWSGEWRVEVTTYNTLSCLRLIVQLLINNQMTVVHTDGLIW